MSTAALFTAAQMWSQPKAASRCASSHRCDRMPETNNLEEKLTMAQISGMSAYGTFGSVLGPDSKPDVTTERSQCSTA